MTGLPRDPEITGVAGCMLPPSGPRWPGFAPLARGAPTMIKLRPAPSAPALSGLAFALLSCSAGAQDPSPESLPDLEEAMGATTGL